MGFKRVTVEERWYSIIFISSSLFLLEITYLPSDLTPTGESEDAASIKHFNIIDHSSFLVLDEKGFAYISVFP